MRLRKNEYLKRATVDTWADGHMKLCNGGFAIVNNWTTLLSPNNLPYTEQRDYIRNVPEGEKQIVFEGVYLDDQSSSVTPHYHKDHVDARRQLKDSMKKGFMDYKAKYAGQQADILKGMFHGEAANSANWKLNWNVCNTLVKIRNWGTLGKYFS